MSKRHIQLLERDLAFAKKKAEELEQAGSSSQHYWKLRAATLELAIEAMQQNPRSSRQVKGFIGWVSRSLERMEEYLGRGDIAAARLQLEKTRRRLAEFKAVFDAVAGDEHQPTWLERIFGRGR